MNAEEYIDSEAQNNTLLEKIDSLVEMVETNDIKRILYKLRTKDQKGVNYTTIFINAYLCSLSSVNEISYKSCNLIVNTTECSCKVSDKSCSDDKVRENLLSILSMYKKSPSIVRSSLQKLLTVFSTEIESTVILSHLSTLEIESESAAVLAEYMHLYYSLGLYYESYRVLLVLSKVPVQQSESTTALKLLLVSKYLIMSSNYRAYLNCIRALQGIGVKISPDRAVVKYVKYQKVITDYDKIVGHVKKSKADTNMTYTVLHPVEETEKECWKWYASELRKNSETEKTEEHSDSIDDLISKVSFLRKNRLKYELVDGKIVITEGNSRNTFIDYITELDAPLVDAAVQKNARIRPEDLLSEPVEKITETEKEPSPVQKRKTKEQIKILFEKKEYLFRNMIKIYKEKQEIESRSRIKSERSVELSIINNRFKLAKEKQLQLLSTVVNRYSIVQELVDKMETKLYVPVESEIEEESEEIEQVQVQEEPSGLVWDKEKAAVEEKTVPEPKLIWGRESADANTSREDIASREIYTPPKQRESSSAGSFALSWSRTNRAEEPVEKESLSWSKGEKQQEQPYVYKNFTEEKEKTEPEFRKDRRKPAETTGALSWKKK